MTLDNIDSIYNSCDALCDKSLSAKKFEYLVQRLVECAVGSPVQSAVNVTQQQSEGFGSDGQTNSV